MSKYFMKIIRKMRWQMFTRKIFTGKMTNISNKWFFKIIKSDLQKQFFKILLKFLLRVYFSQISQNCGLKILLKLLFFEYFFRKFPKNFVFEYFFFENFPKMFFQNFTELSFLIFFFRKFSKIPSPNTMSC